MFDPASIKPLSPIYFVGDSNTLLYRHLSIDLPDYFARRLATNACFVPALSAGSIIEDGNLNARILEYFLRELVIQFKDRYERFTTSGTVEDWAWLQTVMPPLHDIYNIEAPLAVVLMLGTIDLAVLLGKLGTNADFVTDNPRFVESRFSAGPDLPIVPIAFVRSLVETHFEPLGHALRLLRDMRFEDVYVHSLHPPTTDDVLYFRARQTMSSAKIRYKLTLVINEVLERTARANGARFLDMWPETVIDGTVDPALELDGDHLNRAAVDRTLQKLLGDLVARSGVPALR